MALPLEIQERAASLHASRPQRIVSDLVQPGDLRAVRSNDLTKVCVVLKVDAVSAQISTVHPFTDMAMSDDIVVPRDALPFNPGYDIVMQTSIRGVVWLRQLSNHLLGRVPSEVLSYYWKRQDAELPKELGLYRGMNACGVFDARRTFKTEEFKCVQELTRDCTTERLKDWIIGED
jgi:hypothetical protein